MKPPKMSVVRRFRDMVPARDCPGPPRVLHSQNRGSRGQGRDLAGKRRSGFCFRALGAGLKGGGAESVAGTAEKVEPGLGAGLRGMGAGPRSPSTASLARARGSRVELLLRWGPRILFHPVPCSLPGSHLSCSIHDSSDLFSRSFYQSSLSILSPLI